MNEWLVVLPLVVGVGLGFTLVISRVAVESFLRNSTIVHMRDEFGCPKTYYGRQYGVYIGWVYNPLSVAEEAIGLYNRAKSDPSARKRFFNCIDIILNHVVDRGNYAVVVYKFPWGYYGGLPAGWSSAMSQAAAILALYYAYKLSGNEEYRGYAKKLLKAFWIPVEEGGLSYKVGENGLWFEEYAHKDLSVKPFVLNGFMYALIRLYEYYVVSRDDEAFELFRRGMNALKAMIHLFDTGKWTKYDLVGTDASWPKHMLHVKFAERLYELTNDQLMKYYYEKFKGYRTSVEGLKRWARYYFAVLLRRIASMIGVK